MRTYDLLKLFHSGVLARELGRRGKYALVSLARLEG